MQDISLSDSGRKVSRTSVVTRITIAEMKAADQVPESLGRRLSIFSRYVGAVLIESSLPTAPIQPIDNASFSKGDTRAWFAADAYSVGCELLPEREAWALTHGPAQTAQSSRRPLTCGAIATSLSRPRKGEPEGKREGQVLSELNLKGGAVMLTDEEVIEIIAKRMDEECGWSKASTVMNHYGWVDVVTHLYCEKGLRGALLEAYKTDIVNARAKQLLEIPEADRMPL